MVTITTSALAEIDTLPKVQQPDEGLDDILARIDALMALSRAMGPVRWDGIHRRAGIIANNAAG